MPVVTFQVKAQAAQAGAAQSTQEFKAWKSLQFSGITSGTFSLSTLQIQGSNDNSNWSQIGSNITEDGLVELETMAAYMRIYTSSYVSGTPACVMSTHGPGNS
jgi:hypothetical protein